ncbi:MAG TPA: hypothetical protein VMA34_14600 [Terracidiphilus sp.]|nr:hypothetical protein [Terracidiphilus sp.]
MRESGAGVERLELKELVAEASRALARLDANRLEELAVSCQALNRELPSSGPARRRTLVRQACEAQRDLAVFGRVLEATRANLSVMRRLRELRMGRIEYVGRERTWTGRGYGDN